jgi:hypothetical protein
VLGKFLGRTFLVVQSAALVTALHRCGSYALDADPWGGLHAATFCPRICADCRGPYTYAHSTVATGPRGKKEWKTEIHCQREGATPEDPGALASEADIRERSERRFGSGWVLFATLYPAWLVVASVVAFAVVRSRRARPMT